MKRIGTLGLCLAAVLASSAVAGSTAQAGEFGKCLKLTKVSVEYEYKQKVKRKNIRDGLYSDKECTKAAPEPGAYYPGPEGKYEWVSAAPEIKYSSQGGESVLRTAAGEITSDETIAKGEFTSGNTGIDQLTFKGAELSLTQEPCENTANQGEIVTFPLGSQLLDHGTKGLAGREPKEGETWFELFPSEGQPGYPYLAEFECGGIPFSLSGSVSGKLGPVDSPVKLKRGVARFTTKFAESVGEQDLETTFYDPIKSEYQTAPAVFVGEDTLAIAEELELRACNAKVGEKAPVCGVPPAGETCTRVGKPNGSFAAMGQESPVGSGRFLCEHLQKEGEWAYG